MTLDPAAVTPSATPTHPLLRAVMIALVAIAAVLALSAIFGAAGSGPYLDIVADPAGTLPF